MINDKQTTSIYGHSRTKEEEMAYQSEIFRNLAESLKIPRETAIEMAKNLTQLSIDLKEKGDNKIAQDLASGLIGNPRVLYKYGVSLDQASLKTEAYKEGIAEKGSELNKQQKVLAAYNVIMKELS